MKRRAFSTHIGEGATAAAVSSHGAALLSFNDVDDGGGGRGGK